jgi:hypothetical protein
MSVKNIQSALISVYYKDGLAPIIQQLHQAGVTLYSTGGTQTWGNFAIDIYRGRWAYGINLQRKISSSLPAGMAESNVRFGLQATYRLSAKK